jgi:excinuclease ABC subunit B
MKAAIDEGERRRTIQIAYNQKHNIVPRSIKKAIRAKLVEQQVEEGKPTINQILNFSNKDILLPDERKEAMKMLRREMKGAAERLDFEMAIAIRDKINEFKKKI